MAMGVAALDEDDEEPGPVAEDRGWRTIVSRVLAATLGAYVACDLLAAAIGKHLPQGKVDAVLNATMIGLLAYIGLVVWIIAAKSTLRVWAGLLALSAICFVISIV